MLHQEKSGNPVQKRAVKTPSLVNFLVWLGSRASLQYVHMYAQKCQRWAPLANWTRPHVVLNCHIHKFITVRVMPKHTHPYFSKRSHINLYEAAWSYFYVHWEHLLRNR
jgi:hypothetical protein